MESFPGSNLGCTWRLVACSRDHWQALSIYFLVELQLKTCLGQPLACPLQRGHECLQPSALCSWTVWAWARHKHWTVFAVKVFFRPGVPEPEHILLNQSLGFSSLHYIIWQHKVHQACSGFSELQFAVWAVWLSMRMDWQFPALLLCYLYLQFPRASFWEVQAGGIAFHI